MRNREKKVLTRTELINAIMSEKYGEDEMLHDEEYEIFLQSLTLIELTTLGKEILI